VGINNENSLDLTIGDRFHVSAPLKNSVAVA